MNDFDETILPFLICPKTGKDLFYDKKKKFYIPMIKKIFTKLKKESLYLWLIKIMIPNSIKLSNDKKSLQIAYDEKNF